jgi:hypothetical protein
MDQKELVDAVQTLTRSVDDLSRRFDATEKLIDRIEKQRRGLLSTRIALGAVVLLVIAGGVLFARQQSTIRELRAVQDRTSTEILCPLYQFLALSLRVNPPNPTASAEQIELRTSAATAIAAGLEKLGCA